VKNSETKQYPSQLVVDVVRLIAYLISKTFWFIRYSGRENIPPPSAGCFLIAANHPTYVDPVWICLPFRRRLRFMAYDKAFEWRFVGPLIRYLGAFPISHGSGITVSEVKETLRALSDGAILTVFPEGVREFSDGLFLPFRTGAVRIAMQAGVPILPVTIRGGNRIWPRNQKYPNLFRRVEIIYHPLLYLSEDRSEGDQIDVKILTEKLRSIIDEGLSRPEPGGTPN
jgi:1-acyl-sn-glycerol-3-phosphate acyltransferase